jgi:hypothetical protein
MNDESMDAPPIISPNLPPLPPTKKPFAFQAAQASVLAPLISIGLGIAVNLGLGSQPTPSARIITGSLCTLLIGLGFFFGITALFGIRRYGGKGILGRAIAGIVINGLLLICMGLAVMRMTGHN